MKNNKSNKNNLNQYPPPTDMKFKYFMTLWNELQNYETPDLHLKMANWLEHCWHSGKHRLLLMAFRGAGKSTIVGLFAAWLICRNSNIRILVLAADSTLAAKLVRNVKRIIERHPLTEHLKPANADQWASDRFTVNRDLELRDPSMLAKGISSNITGLRADVVICDDVEVPNTCDTPDKRADLRERLGELPYILTAKGTQLYIGTPHHFYSIYADVPREDIGEEQPFLAGFERFLLPVYDENNNSAWPEQYSLEDIKRNLRNSGPNKFDSQMLLRFVNILEGRLNPDLLQYYNAEIEFDYIRNKLYIGHNEMESVSCWWDPSFGSAKSDDSVCAIVFSDKGGDFFLHHLEYIRIDETDSTNEAKQQARIIADLAKKYYLPSVTVEINGIGKFLPSILRNELADAKSPTRVMEISSKKPKAMRILEGFDAVMAAKRLYVHERVRKDTPFLMEMREWIPSGYGTTKSSKGKDDALDAVAGAIYQHPERLKRFFSQGSYSWQRGGKTYKGKGIVELD